MNNGYAICPFYQRHKNKKIVCEGPMRDTLVTTTFATVEETKEHFHIYCESFKYKECPYVEMEREEITDDELIRELQEAFDQVRKFRKGI